MKFYNLDQAIQNAAVAEELTLHNRGLTAFPEEIFQLRHLKVLALSSNSINHIPAEIARLVNLESLDLRDNQIHEFPQSIRELGHLRKIDLSKNVLDQVQNCILALSELEVLILAENEIQSLPEEISQLKRLRKLDLSKNQIQRLPTALFEMSNLRQLDLSSNLLRRLPKNFGQLQSIDRLYLSKNQLSKLPDSIGLLKNMSQIDLSSNKLKKLPATLGNCTHLRQLLLNQNKLETIPEEIGQLHWLSKLNLSKNKLSQIPKSIGQCKQLQDLDVTHNHIKSLPETLHQLNRLYILHLGHNQLTQLPALPIRLNRIFLNKNDLKKYPDALSKAIHLKKLDISGNAISAIPASLGKLQQLNVLSIQANPIQKFPNALLQLDQLKTLRGFTFYKGSKLLQFIKACCQKNIPFKLRIKLHEIFLGEEAVLKSFSTKDLFLGLQVKINALEYPLRQELFSRGEALIKVPLKAGSVVKIVGSTRTPVRVIAERLAQQGIQYSAKSSDEARHVLIGSQPKYDPKFEQKVVFLSEKDLIDFLNQAEKKYLIQETSEEKLGHIQQLLHHESETNVWMASQILEGGGVPKVLITDLFIVWKKRKEAKLKKALKILLDLNLSEYSKHQIQQIGVIRAGLSRKNLEEKIKALGTLEELDEGKLSAAFLN